MADYFVEKTVDALLGELEGVSDNAVWTGALSGVRAAANQLGLGGIKITLPVPQAIINDILDSAGDFVTPDDSSSPPPVPAMDLAAVDPLEPLKKIAAAINEAEGLLNQENLVIATGEVEATFNVDVGGVAGANAAVRITIQPRQEA